MNSASTIGRLTPALGLAGLCIAVALFGDIGREWGRYARSLLEQGQLWRLLTAHFVHLGWGHVGLNLAGLGLTAWLLQDVLSRMDWLATVAISIVVIDTGLYLLEPQIEWYVGLSGVLHALLAVGAIRLWRVSKALGSVLFAGLVCKLLWEQLAGPSEWSELASGGPVVVAAHAFGFVGGMIYALLTAQVRREHGSSL
jgi:rhomboid family GlyGly-CTERM serine protease